MAEELCDGISQLGLEDKECGAGNSLAVTTEVACGEGSEMSPMENGAGGGSSGHQDNHDQDVVEIFKSTLGKKKNIYSTDAIPLNSPWTFWVDRTERGASVAQFEANLKEISTAYTVYNLWNIFYNIPKPCKLLCHASLHVMRDKRKPVWEEPYNCKGGVFRLRVQKKDTEKVWKEMLVAAVGEQLTEFVAVDDEVCGVSVSIRETDDVVQVWNINAEAAVKAKIFECAKTMLPDTNFLATTYKPHETHQAFEKSRSGMFGMKEEAKNPANKKQY